MFILVLVDEVIIPAIEATINGLVKAFQTKAFWIVVASLAVIAFGISALSGLSLREVVSIEHVSDLWGLAGTEAPSPDDPHGGSETDKYRGGATPYDG